METIINPTVIPKFPKPYAKWKAALLKLEPNQYLRVTGEWKDNTLRQACRRASIGGRRFCLLREGTEIQLWRVERRPFAKRSPESLA